MLKVDQWLDQWLARVIPRRCVLCQQHSGAGCVCTGCRDDLPWLGPACPFCGLALPAGVSAGPCGRCRGPGAHPYRVLAPLAYEYPVDRMVTAAKFHRKLHFARALGELLAGAIARDPGSRPLPELLLPVPLHPHRLAERGYNQAAELTRPLAELLKVPVETRLCQRVRHTQEQSGLSAAERRRNLRGAFEVRGNCAGASVAVVDDVITTGSTAAALATALLDAGAASVQVWAAARTL